MQGTAVLKKFAPLALALLALAAMSMFAFTDLAWCWAGRPDESYPEIAYLFLGLPAALAATGAGLLFLGTSMGDNKTKITAYLVYVPALAICGCLVASAIFPLLIPS